jgi:kynurenine formamidase
VPELGIVDLSVAFSEGMPRFPAEWFPDVSVRDAGPPADRQSRRFTTLRLSAHNGTHVESSDHVVTGGVTLDDVPLRSFAGFPVIVDLRDVAEGTEVAVHTLEQRLPSSHVAPGQVVLLMTGYDDRNWGRADFWERSPWLSAEAAEYIASTRPALVGLDFQTEMPSASDFAVHRILLERGIVLCEYLFNLERINEQTLFLAFPIKVAGVEAAPTRAVGINGLTGA